MKVTVTVELTFEADVTYFPGAPARISGPPENCYPAEDDEWELNSLTYDGEDMLKLLVPNGVASRLYDDILDALDEAVTES